MCSQDPATLPTPSPLPYRQSENKETLSQWVTALTFKSQPFMFISCLVGKSRKEHIFH